MDGMDATMISFSHCPHEDKNLGEFVAVFGVCGFSLEWYVFQPCSPVGEWKNMEDVSRACGRGEAIAYGRADSTSDAIAKAKKAIDGCHPNPPRVSWIKRILG